MNKVHLNYRIPNFHKYYT